jgi:Ca2+-binding EF-hand superfamily protein
MASPNGATISQDQAAPYIVNFQMVDVDGDGKITADEFNAACGKGLVKNTNP